ncbi:DUF916 and DUF3324 domain-containing protein [Lacticaseibacillus jixiensis]|uniref:DUF916 and DUF3324 domain-containing protein n=1 Tax=Lacticaseibacillus jixiensis TaxID=3231926 RepID=UPI0036F283B3
MLKKFWAFALAVGMLTLGGQSVQAAATDFAVAPQLPANQIDHSVHYYSLLVQPGSQQDLTLLVQNGAATAARFKVSPNRATTGSDGDIDYTQHTPAKPEGLPLDIETLLPKPKVYTIPARTTKTLHLPLKAPKTAFEGILLGAIRVEKLSNDPTKQTNIAYTIGVQLQSSQQLPASSPKLGFDGVKLTYTTTGAHVAATIDNPASMIQSGLTVQTHIYRRKTHHLIAHHQQAGIRMAPNSQMFVTADNAKALVPGDYQLVVNANNGATQWHFTRNFSIKSNLLKSTAAKDPATPNSQALPAWLTVMLLVIALLLAAIVWSLVRKRHRQ